jgi:hypothetical protein
VHNVVCHADTNPHAIAIEVQIKNQVWSKLHRGDCTPTATSVIRFRGSRYTRVTYCFYGECSGANYRLRTAPSNPDSGVWLYGRSARIIRVVVI